MNSHNKLIKQMQTAGYKADPEGVCFGVASMGMQAFLSADVDSFDERLKAIVTLEDGKSIPNDFLPFFDGIELYFQPHVYPHLFEKNKAPLTQNADLTSAIVSSKILEEKGGLAKVGDFSGCYDQDELKSYFEEFSQIIDHYQFKHPVAFILGSGGHVIMVGYDPMDKRWLFIDANNLPTKHNLKANEVAKFVKAALAPYEKVALSILLYVTESAKKTWHITPCFQKEPLLENIQNLSESELFSWLYVAAYHGHIKTVKALLEAKKDPNDASWWLKGKTPLFSTSCGSPFRSSQCG